MEKSVVFEKNIKSGKKFLIVGTILLIITCAFSILMFFSYQSDMKNPTKLIDIKEEGKYAKVSASVMTDYFATNDYTGREHKSYFIYDNQYMYIVDLNEKTRKELDVIYNYSYDQNEDAVAPNSVEIKGMTKKIPSDLKQIAINAYNELYGEKLVNNSNFSTYFGDVYLDTYESPMTDFSYTFVYSFPFLLIGLIFLFSYFKISHTTKKNKMKYNEVWDKILKEVNDSELYYKKAKLYLTNSYIISYQNGLEIYDYKDVVWVYPHEYRYNGAVTQKSIFVVTKNGKAHKLSTLSTSKKNKILFDELYNTLMNKMPDVLKGYTKENIKAAKELYEK